MQSYFFNLENNPHDQLALIDDVNSVNLTYGSLIRLCSKIEKYITSEKKELIFLFSENNYQSIAAYLAILRSNNTCCLIDDKIDDNHKKRLINAYKPGYIISSASEKFKNYNENEIYDSLYLSNYTGGSSEENNIIKDLALLLTTSGSTGSPKLVKLSYKNLQSNAESISQYLNIDSYERAITSLPMFYSFGLSVINSHLLAGASIVLTNKSIILRDFWYTFKKHDCTSFTGVPYSYDLLEKLHFAEMNLPSLKYMTQAGGKLSDKLQKKYALLSQKKGFKFFVMYGQTEATARISYVPNNMLLNKIGSIGIPIPGGKLFIKKNGKIVTKIGEEGELVYSGDNVMMGYSYYKSDLEMETDLKELHTGDIGKFDEDGYFFVTGRIRRIIKLHGARFNLDEIEEDIKDNFACDAAALGIDDDLRIILVATDITLLAKVKNFISKSYKINLSLITIKIVSSIPMNNFGKTDYVRLNSEFGELKNNLSFKRF